MSEEPIAILADSTCDIPEHLIQQYNIIIIPQTIIWGSKQYRDRVDLQPGEFYRRLAVEPVRPTSSLPKAQDFLNAFEAAASQGAKQIVLLTVSSAMSGTYQMAKNLAERSKIPVTVIDSKGPTMTLGWQVLAAARARERGEDLPTILDEVSRVRSRMAQFVAMVSLEYLQRGGRIGGAIRWAGTLLKVKPLVSINHQTGLVEPVGLSRTQKALEESLFEKFAEKVSSEKTLHVAVLHGDDPQKGEALAKRVQQELKPVELLVNCTGPVLGINTGPGALALCGYTEGIA